MKTDEFKKLILLETEDYILINKPPHLSTLEDRVSPRNILAMAREYVPTAQACHRLDKDTSGVLVLAKNPEAYRTLSMQFESRDVTKIYHAVADGLHQFDQELVDRPLEKQNDGTVRISGNGKKAMTYFQTIRVYKRHTLVECKPVTGRMHQIRVHMAFRSAPIAGDELYGGKPVFLSFIKRGFKLGKNVEEKPLMDRMALHAFSIDFAGSQGEKIAAQAPYPKDFRALTKQLSDNLR
jgi:23S rRNA pseudouridine955/2504/2580 synthase